MDHSSTSLPRPLATSSSSMQRRSSSSTRFAHAPIVMAMLTNNRLSNCSDVSAMVHECQAKGNDNNDMDQLCRTAAGYLDMCLVRNE